MNDNDETLPGLVFLSNGLRRCKVSQADLWWVFLFFDISLLDHYYYFFFTRFATMTTDISIMKLAER